MHRDIVKITIDKLKWITINVPVTQQDVRKTMKSRGNKQKTNNKMIALVQHINNYMKCKQYKNTRNCQNGLKEKK